MQHAPNTQAEKLTMTPIERRAGVSMALIFALRILGIFLVMPVFAVEAEHYTTLFTMWRDPSTGFASKTAVGMALGAYGATQAMLQLLFGLMSDRIGRKRVISLGLLIMVAGSMVAALAGTIEVLILGRALQGAGAISAAGMALLSDLTRSTVRTRAMGFISISMSLAFGLALLLGSSLNAWRGLSGLFWFNTVLGFIAILVLYTLVPTPAPNTHVRTHAICWRKVLQHRGIWWFNLGACLLHAIHISMWVALPNLVRLAGLPSHQHWFVYIPALLGGLLLMAAILFPLERRNRTLTAYLLAIGLLATAQLALFFIAQKAHVEHPPHIWVLGCVLLTFFIGFNLLEATQPSTLSKIAPTATRGIIMGLYTTSLSIGVFLGGALGGILVSRGGAMTLFATNTVVCVLWLLVNTQNPMFQQKITHTNPHN